MYSACLDETGVMEPTCGEGNKITKIMKPCTNQNLYHYLF